MFLSCLLEGIGKTGISFFFCFCHWTGLCVASCATSTVDVLQKTPSRYGATSGRYLPGRRASVMASVTYSDKGPAILEQFMIYKIWKKISEIH